MSALRQKRPDELDRPDVATALTAERLGLTLILEDVRSGNNVGSIFRTADAFGLAEVILVGITPHPPHREILKSSLGAELAVPWRSFATVAEAIDILREEGKAVWALEQTTASVALQEFGFAEPLGRRSPKRPLAVVVGNEVRGVSPEALELVDGAIEIAQFGMKHSLNVSVAVGVLAYALRHQSDESSGLRATTEYDGPRMEAR